MLPLHHVSVYQVSTQVSSLRKVPSADNEAVQVQPNAGSIRREGSSHPKGTSFNWHVKDATQNVQTVKNVSI